MLNINNNNNNHHLNVNNIKNFLNQTLLHFACENQDYHLCKLLLENGADCLIEDNYRQTPFIFAAKRNYLSILELFVTFVSSDLTDTNRWKQVRKTAYYACCAGNYKIVQHLFKSFGLVTEKLIEGSNLDLEHVDIKPNFSELNPLHVSCYKSNFDIVNFLLINLSDKSLTQEFLNSPFNEYRDSTSLEEAFKGFLMFDLNTSYETNGLRRDSKTEREEKILSYKNLINLLIENGAKFSNNFISNNGLVKLLIQVFSGCRKDLDFVHFLFCCNFLFKFKLNEILSSDGSSVSSLNNQVSCEFSKLQSKLKSSVVSLNRDNHSDGKKFDHLRDMIDEFLFKCYFTCTRVIKDYKALCLNYFIELVLNLHYNGQFFINVDKFSYLKDKNMEIYNFFSEISSKAPTLKLFCSMSIRDSIKNYGIGKVNSLNIPNVLKNEIFSNSLSRICSPQYDYHSYLLCKEIKQIF